MTLGRDKAVDVALGLSALWWSVELVLGAGEGARSMAMDLSLALLDLVVAWLFFRRTPSRPARGAPLLLALVTVGAAAATMRLIGGPWSPVAQGLFVVGALGAAASLGRLGKSFAVLPAERDVVASGPYAFVRHPAYAFELLMLLAALSAGGPLAWALGGVVVLLQVARAHAEERLLMRDARYRAYAARVPHRLIPRVY